MSTTDTMMPLVSAPWLDADGKPPRICSASYGIEIAADGRDK
jgi:hypothetical protein